MTDKRPPLHHTSLYAPLFKTGAGNPSHFKVMEDRFERDKFLSVLDDIQLMIEKSSLELSTRNLLEQRFTRMITDHIKAAYSSQAVVQLFLDAIGDLDPSDAGLADDLEDDLEDSFDNTEIEQNFNSCSSALKGLG
jgi:hypothetical protein